MAAIRAAGLLGVVVAGCAACATPRPEPAAPQTARATAASPTPSSPAAPPPAAPLLGAIDWSRAQLRTDEDAQALWQQIAPTGADWELRLLELPKDQDLQTRLALALLRGGNFQCRAASSCPADSYFDVAPTATLSDPCLRRLLALWAFDQLDDTQAASLERELLALAALPPPEEELVREAFDLVPLDRDDLLLPMITAARAAGQIDLADAAVHWLSPANVRKVATALHSDGAYAALDVNEARGAFLAAISDRQLKAQTSSNAITELIAADDGALRKDVRAALQRAVKDPRCAVAAAAARQLAVGGDRRFVPRRDASSVPAALRALCVMSSYLEEEVGVDSLLRPFFSAAGVQIFDHTETSDSDGEVAAELIARADLVTLPFLSDLGDALEHCLGTTCRTGIFRFELTMAPDRSISRIERFFEASPCNN
jgi:hypothetical protein